MDLALRLVGFVVSVLLIIVVIGGALTTLYGAHERHWPTTVMSLIVTAVGSVALQWLWVLTCSSTC